MSYALSQVKEHLIGMGHGGTLNKVRNQEALFERAGNNMLAKIDPDETIRSAALLQTDPDTYRYELPVDFKKLIDIAPTAARGSYDDVRRVLARPFDIQKAFATRLISIEAEDGTKFLRSNYAWSTAKYYSKFLFKSAGGAWEARPVDDGDLVVCDSDTLNIFLYECLIEMAQQMEGTDSSFDIGFATRKLHGDPTAVDGIGRSGLYSLYVAEHPTQSRKSASNYGSMPRFRR